MRIVASLAVETVRTLNLVRVSDFLKIVLVAVAVVADVRCNGSQETRRATQRGQVLAQVPVSSARSLRQTPRRSMR